MKKLLTLLIVYNHPKVLLGMKKRGFGAGRWNGFGGKVEQGETIEDAVKREAQEEAGIRVDSIEKVGILDFIFYGNPEILQVHIFKAVNFFEEPKETEEMKPQWFNIKDIPFKEMWPDDECWMPIFLSGKKFKGRFLFGKADAILEKELVEVEEL